MHELVTGVVNGEVSVSDNLYVYTIHSSLNPSPSFPLYHHDCQPRTIPERARG